MASTFTSTIDPRTGKRRVMSGIAGDPSQVQDSSAFDAAATRIPQVAANPAARVRFNEDGSTMVGNRLMASNVDPATGQYAGRSGISANPANFDANGRPRQGLGFGEGGSNGVLGRQLPQLMAMEQVGGIKANLANIAKDSAMGVEGLRADAQKTVAGTEWGARKDISTATQQAETERNRLDNTTKAGIAEGSNKTTLAIPGAQADAAGKLAANPDIKAREQAERDNAVDVAYGRGGLAAKYSSTALTQGALENSAERNLMLSQHDAFTKELAKSGTDTETLANIYANQKDPRRQFLEMTANGKVAIVPRSRLEARLNKVAQSRRGASISTPPASADNGEE